MMLKIDVGRLAGLRSQLENCRVVVIAANARVLELRDARNRVAERLRFAQKSVDACRALSRGTAEAISAVAAAEAQLREAEAELVRARQDAAIAGERWDAAARLLSNCEQIAKGA